MSSDCRNVDNKTISKQTRNYFILNYIPEVTSVNTAMNIAKIQDSWWNKFTGFVLAAVSKGNFTSVLE